MLPIGEDLDVMKLASDNLDHARRGGQVEYVVCFGLPLLVELAEIFAQLGVGAGVSEVGAQVVDVRREAAPFVVFRIAAAGEAVHALAEVLAKGGIVLVEPIDADQGKLLWQPAV